METTNQPWYLNCSNSSNQPAKKKTWLLKFSIINTWFSSRSAVFFFSAYFQISLLLVVTDADWLDVCSWCRPVNLKCNELKRLYPSLCSQNRWSHDIQTFIQVASNEYSTVKGGCNFCFCSYTCGSRVSFKKLQQRHATSFSKVLSRINLLALRQASLEI